MDKYQILAHFDLKLEIKKLHSNTVLATFEFEEFLGYHTSQCFLPGPEWPLTLCVNVNLFWADFVHLHYKGIMNYPNSFFQKNNFKL